MRHIHFFSRAPKGGVLGGGQKVYVEKVYVLFLSRNLSTQTGTYKRKNDQKDKNSALKRRNRRLTEGLGELGL